MGSKFLICKVCGKTKVEVGITAVAVTCSDCVLAPIQKRKVEPVSSKPVAEKKARFSYKSAAPRGARSKIVDAAIKAGKEVDAIVTEVLSSFPNENRIHIRNLVYVRRGAIKGGQLSA